jgi:hypothetical protein
MATFAPNDEGIQQLARLAAARIQAEMMLALEVVGVTHHGRPVGEVMDAIVAECARRGVTVSPDGEQVQKAAALISGASTVTVEPGPIVS